MRSVVWTRGRSKLFDQRLPVRGCLEMGSSSCLSSFVFIFPSLFVSRLETRKSVD